MFIIENLTYKINHIDTIFENLSFTIGNEKIAIVGQNGIGKSILLQLLIGELKPYYGEIIKNGVNFSYFPQKFNELNFSTVADVFGFEKQVISLKKVDEGTAEAEDYGILDGNWDCIDKIQEKMKFFGLKFELLRDFRTLSGGEKVKLILSSIIDKNSNFLILDEPTNNMDYESKKCFYEFIRNWQNGLIVVSHDRELLNLVNKIYELRRIGMKNTKIFVYGGNFDYWKKQKEIEEKALENQYEETNKKISHQKKILQSEREFAEKKRKQGESGLATNKYPKKGYGLMKMAAESKRGQLVIQDIKRVERTEKNISELENKIEVKQKIYFKFSQNTFSNKFLVQIENLSFWYGMKQIFNDFSFEVFGGERIAIEGKNGSGKTTLLKLIMNKLAVSEMDLTSLTSNCTIANDSQIYTNMEFKGEIRVNAKNIAYLDQNCDFLQNNETILKNIQSYNSTISEKDCRDILAQFLFRTDDVYKKIKNLSGGEKLRVALACVLSDKNTPELLLLDEPTNNMDLDSIQVLENILNQYKGAIVLISHDKVFKENIKIKEYIKIN
ncbi:MAG TPA: ABC-F family ATP-binding cassette domain-containing protein [Rickettsiales bacterium]|nr:ABC-F family ATP-binding cassette domain-containing protein [Rickettsiales bacterium]